MSKLLEISSEELEFVIQNTADKLNLLSQFVFETNFFI